MTAAVDGAKIPILDPSRRTYGLANVNLGTLANSARLSLKIYKLYQGHINMMFNYFLIISGLVANAYIQAIGDGNNIDRAVAAAIGVFGVVMSVLSLLIHLRSRAMLDTIEAGLLSEEQTMFAPGEGFLNIRLPRSPWYLRHKYQFPLTHGLVALVFGVMALYALLAA